MKKGLFKGFVLSALLFLGADSFAQNITGTSRPEVNNYEQGFRLGFGVNAGFVTGDFFNFGLGGDVRLQYDLTQRGSITLTTGYTHLFGQEDFIDDLGFIPVKAGFKGFIWENRFYILGEAGAGFAVTNDYNQTTFLWSPGVGYANDIIDISLRYEGMNDFQGNQIALRFAYGFRL